MSKIPDQIERLEDQLTSATGLDEIDILNALAAELATYDQVRAGQLAQQALKLSQNANPNESAYEKGISYSQATLGSIATSRNDYRTALHLLLQSQALLEKLADYKKIPNVMRDLGWVYFNLGDIPQAIEILHNALKIARDCSDSYYESYILCTLGAVYGESGDKDESISVLQRALTFAEANTDNRLRCLILNNLAMTQFEIQAYELALASAAESLKIAQNLEIADLIVSILDTTGQIYLASQDYTKAEGYFNQALAHYHGAGNDPDEIKLNLARATIGLGRLNDAAGWLKESLESVQARGVNRFTYQVHELLSQIYEKKGELPAALEQFKLFHKCKTEVYNEETQRRLGNLMASQQAETARTDEKIYELRNRTLLKEISDYRQAVAEMEVLATKDSLTGMLNRRHFMTLGAYAFDSARRAGQTVAALMVDLDDFKRVNDRYGHLAGDQVLMDVTSIIQSSLRKEDLVGRIGGEEFAALLTGTELNDVERISDRILRNVAEHKSKVGTKEIQITLSIGIALLDSGIESLAKLLERSDDAMYAAKKAGKNRVMVW
jgi:diguanylate cyclase (GGDEF)-like protein